MIRYLCLLVLLGMCPSCNKYAGISAAYSTTIAVERRLREADPHVGGWFRRAKADCKKKRVAYRKCIKPTADKVRAFVAVGKKNRAGQDTIRAVHLGLKKANLITLGAAIVCAALSATSVIGNFVAKVAKVAAKLRAIKGVACGLAK